MSCSDHPATSIKRKSIFELLPQTPKYCRVANFFLMRGLNKENRFQNYGCRDNPRRIQFAFYFGYFFMALPAALFIRKYSFKSGIILGLILYAIGSFLFYPAAAFEEFTFFLISLWVITCGLAFLETTSNPLILSGYSRSISTIPSCFLTILLFYMS